MSIDLPLLDLEEPAGTVLVGSQNKRVYLFLSMTEARMEIERTNARNSGVQDLREFVFVFEGHAIELTYEQLKQRLFDPIQCYQPPIDDM